MVDGGEHVSATLKREFGEEALNSIEDEQKEETKTLIAEFFKGGEKVWICFRLNLFREYDCQLFCQVLQLIPKRILFYFRRPAFCLA